MTIIKPISTNIKQIIKMDNNLLIIREDYYKFEGISNVYCLENADIIWYAELPKSNDYFSNDLRLEDNVLKASSWDGYTIEIDVGTGKILRKSFTK